MAAATEERFTRKKHDFGFPANAIRSCLQACQLSLMDLSCIVFYDKPLIKFERILETYLGFAPKGIQSFVTAMPVWLKEKLLLKDLLKKEFTELSPGLKKTDLPSILFTEHHVSHAASAFYPSPFEEAAVLTMDGVGEWATTSVAHGKGNHIEILKEIHFPHSLGLLYSAFTSFTGFKVNSGEYKLMGLAPYGEPKYADRIFAEVVDLRDDGSLQLNMKYFDYVGGLKMTNAAFDRLFDGPPRRPESKLTQREMDLAASIQLVTETAMLNMARFAHRETGLHNLCLAGGVALNCVGNGKILREGPFTNLWIQPAAGDAGGALGAALLVRLTPSCTWVCCSTSAKAWVTTSSSLGPPRSSF
jgi:carbamoyltransferase